MLIEGGQPGASNRPPETVTATSHGDTVDIPNRLAAATAAASITATASAHPPPAGPGITASTANARNHTVNTPRTSSTRPAKRRNQPRTVCAGHPTSAPIRRNPNPPALPTNAAPITAAVSALRNNATTGSSTCVTPHPAHRVLTVAEDADDGVVVNDDVRRPFCRVRSSR